MQFQRMQRYDDVVFTERREKAFLRKQQRERERYPLFAEHIANEQHTVDEEKQRRMALTRNSERSQRAFLSGCWRKARALYYSQPTEVRQAIKAYWEAFRGPKTAVYFASIVDEMSGEQKKRLIALGWVDGRYPRHSPPPGSRELDL